MSDSKPGFTALVSTEEVQLWAAGPDNNHKRFETKVEIGSTSTDAGNSPTTTLRGGIVMAKKDSDSKCYPYSAAATDGTQKVVGVLGKYLSMLDRFGTAEDKLSKLLTQGILKNPTVDLIGVDKVALAVLFRTGFTSALLEPHGSSFLLHPKTRYFKTADYTLLDADHGVQFIADGSGAVNFTLPDLATVGPGYEVLLTNAANQNMVVTAPVADTIVYDDTAGGYATTLTWSTGNQKMGAQVLMRSDYNAAGVLKWYPMMIQRTVVAA